MRAFKLLMVSSLLIISCNTIKSSDEIVGSLEDQLKVEYESGRFKESISLLNQLIENDSTRGDLFYKRGFSNAQMFEYSAADEDFKNAIRLDYRKSDSYYNLALVTLALTDEALAITYLNESLRFNAQNGEAKELLSELLGN